MALNKEIIKDNGLATTYHRILHIHMDCSGNKTRTSVSIASYVDESYRLKEKSGECENTVAVIENYDLNIPVNSDSLAFSTFYNKLKETETFEDSENC